MSIEGLVISLAVLVVVALWVATPFLRGKVKVKPDDIVLQKQRERLLVHYERVLTNIRDLEEDYSTGKLQKDEYEAERENWVQRGIQVLKALDDLSSDLLHQQKRYTAVATTTYSAIDEDIDSTIEAAIAAYRGQK